jgi:hypothetical protein
VYVRDRGHRELVSIGLEATCTCELSEQTSYCVLRYNEVVRTLHTHLHSCGAAV